MSQKMCRNREISTDLTVDEYERWKRKVEQSGLTSSALLRILALKGEIEIKTAK